jgi:hypothetical protein
MQYTLRARGYSLPEKHKRFARANPDTLPVNHFVGVLSDERRCRNGNDCYFGTPSTSSQSQTDTGFFLWSTPLLKQKSGRDAWIKTTFDR